MSKTSPLYFHLFLLSSIATMALLSAGCTPSGASAGANLSEGYVAPQSSSPVDQTDSLRSQYRDWSR